jgi:rhodanese-related sulfurtransferase
MDLEKLNKSQIVLLTLLVSFVTSIATGIVTVALMEQAPQAITQTVNRVVERTIEKVAADAQTAAAASADTSQPVIIRESDLLVTAIEQVAPSVVRLFAPGTDTNGAPTRVFIGIAIVTDANGILIADPSTPDSNVTALRHDGVEVPVNIISRIDGANMVRLQAPKTYGESNTAIAWEPVTLSSKSFAVGKAVVAIGGRTSMKVAQGIITGASETEGDNSAGFVETSIPADSFAAGSPLIDSDGTVIAVATGGSRSAAPGGFLASSAIVLQNNTSEGGQGAP